ncbi:splicing factor 45 isoform X1 [Dermacentor andersoni]|uniref:splicing factor 45 isoform X1 n=1 Tax=Dermacentor andersoni TaxID=34620 RepID=UPI002155BA7F|nr:splicing factor 45-like isoform X1 [Dermacentor andersoni]
MSLYDGLGLDSKDKGPRDQKADLAGWSSGIKLLQSQLQLKKAAMTQPRRDIIRKGSAIMAPVMDLKSRRDDPDEMPPPPAIFAQAREGPNTASLLGGDWDVRLEYDPLWPNDYEKLTKERRERKEKEDRKHDDRKRRDKGDRDRDREKDRPPIDDASPPRPSRAGLAGAAIAPPPSLVQDTGGRDDPGSPRPGIGSGSVAQRIMARYGYKAGQGLGKQEQGMSQALQVEKTSKRGGKIIHEKDIAKDPLPPPVPPMAPPLMGPPPSSISQQQQQQQQNESITDMMRNPSKVVLLRNMVGPGEVDDDLEPETKEECSKYGEVVRCLIYEMPGVADEDAVRIFIEFKSMASAIKAVVDTNGRYFGGRIVKASFYDHDKFKRLELSD